MNTELKNLIGKKVLKVFMDEGYLRFETDGGNLTYAVGGDCCSHSFFYDFYGVKNLLENGAVKEVKSVELHPTDLLTKQNDYDCIQVYGYQITTESKDYGEVTSVFSFRNSSNGYYGGYIDEIDQDNLNIPELTEDVYEI